MSGGSATRAWHLQHPVLTSPSAHGHIHPHGYSSSLFSSLLPALRKAEVEAQEDLRPLMAEGLLAGFTGNGISRLGRVKWCGLFRLAKTTLPPPLGNRAGDPKNTINTGAMSHTGSGVPAGHTPIPSYALTVRVKSPLSGQGRALTQQEHPRAGADNTWRAPQCQRRGLGRRGEQLGIM